MIGAATVVGGHGVRSLKSDWPFAHAIVAAAALILAAWAVYRPQGRASQVVETIPPHQANRARAAPCPWRQPGLRLMARARALARLLICRLLCLAAARLWRRGW